MKGQFPGNFIPEIVNKLVKTKIKCCLASCLGILYTLQKQKVKHFRVLNWASLVAEMVKNPPAIGETWVRSLGWEDLLKEGMATHSSIPAWRIPMDRGATVPGVTKSWTQLRD